MAETTLERAARAAAREYARRLPRSDYGSDVRHDWNEIARAVLMAVREPSALSAEFGRWAAHREAQDWGEYATPAMCAASFSAMIDAILAEGGALAISPRAE